MLKENFVFGVLFVLIVGAAGEVKEAKCSYKIGMVWQDDCTVLYVSLEDAANNVTVDTAMLTVNQDDSKTADMDRIKISLGNLIENYQETRSRDLLDIIQTRHQCCGVDGYNDWEKNSEYSCSSTSGTSCGVPRSCCKLNKRSISCGAGALDSARTPSPEEKLTTRGCAEQLSQRSVCFGREFDTTKPNPDAFPCFYDDSEQPIRRAFTNAACPISVSVLLLLVQVLINLF